MASWKKIISEWAWDTWEPVYKDRPWLYWNVWYREDTSKRTVSSATYEFKVEVWLQYTQSWIGYGNESDPKSVKFKIQLGSNSSTIQYKNDNQYWGPAADRHRTTKYTTVKYNTNQDGGTIVCKLTAFGLLKPSISKSIKITMSNKPYSNPGSFKVTKVTPHISSSVLTAIVENSATVTWSKPSVRNGTLQYEILRNKTTVKSGLSSQSVSLAPPPTRGSQYTYTPVAYLKQATSYRTTSSNSAYIKKASLPNKIDVFNVYAKLFSSNIQYDTQYFSSYTPYQLQWAIKSTSEDPDGKTVTYQIQYNQYQSSKSQWLGWTSLTTVKGSGKRNYTQLISAIPSTSQLQAGDSLRFRIRAYKVTDDNATLYSAWTYSNTLVRATPLTDLAPTIIAPRIDMTSVNGQGISYNESGYLQSITLVPMIPHDYIGQPYLESVVTFQYPNGEESSVQGSFKKRQQVSYDLISSTVKALSYPTSVKITSYLRSIYGDTSKSDTVYATQLDPSILSYVSRGDIVKSSDYQLLNSAVIDAYRSYQLISSVQDQKDLLAYRNLVTRYSIIYASLIDNLSKGTQDYPINMMYQLVLQIIKATQISLLETFPNIEEKAGSVLLTESHNILVDILHRL